MGGRASSNLVLREWNDPELNYPKALSFVPLSRPESSSPRIDAKIGSEALQEELKQKTEKVKARTDCPKEGSGPVRNQTKHTRRCQDTKGASKVIRKRVEHACADLRVSAFVA